MRVLRVGLVVVVGWVVTACSGVQAPVDSGMNGADSGLDAGGQDAGTPDAGSSDAGMSDAGASDAGPGDAGTACVVAFQGAVHFAATESGCTSRRFVTLRNLCPTPQSIALGAAAPFAVDGGQVSLPASGAIDVDLTFTPTSTGPVTGQLTGPTARGGAGVTLDGEGVTGAATTDVFTVAVDQKLNVLAVVSDAPGMSAAQQLIGANLAAFWQYATASGWTLQGAALVGRDDGGTATWSAQVPDVAFGQAGAPTTSCLGRTIDELWRDTSPLLPDAGFVALCVQNSDEQPLPGQRAAWLHGLASLAGTDAPMINAHGNFMPGCASDDAVLRALTDATGGSAVSVCAPDGGTNLPMPGTVFTLSRPLGGDGGVSVELDGQALPPVDPQSMTPIWSYEAARNALVFTLVGAPPPGATLTVRYDAACAP